ncbi:MAG: hypothetical protein KME43_17240 [Myxacorys chilensis ATA2-1-KO14]|nr:hypothetical protein [Myxacorys chilensis ATA2-1-KO14]
MCQALYDRVNLGDLSAMLFDRRFPKLSLSFLVLLAITSGAVVYWVSPLRDPSFQPGTNAGSLIPWVQSVSEETWVIKASLLAALFATNITFITWQWTSARVTQMMSPSQRVGRISPVLALYYARLLGTWICMFIGFDALFIGYLLYQWMID